MTASTPDRDVARARALVEEACRKSSMLWLRIESDQRTVAAWHVWSEGAAYVVSGGLEQDLPMLAEPANDRLVVTVRSKDTGGRLVTWVGSTSRVLPEDEEWGPIVAELHAKRLNSPDGEAQPARWARESVVTRIEPTGELLESPGHLRADSHAAEPVPSPATTRGPLPFKVGRAPRRRR
ncbi:MAG: hypothetical protein QOH75_3152 [Actinomycetota bacterium]|nr:hypothetical protein [Actinomycetota bacterium]